MNKNNTDIKQKDNVFQQNINKNTNNTIIAGKQSEIIIKTGEGKGGTPIGASNAIVFKGAKNVQNEDNNIMTGQQQNKQKSWIETIKDWFSSWSCSCDCKSCIDNETEINLESNVDKPRNITPGEW